MPKPKDTTAGLQKLLDDKQIKITILGEYINQKQPVECRCDICGFIWKTTSTVLKNWKGFACRHCSKNSVRSLDDLQSRLDNMGKPFTVLGNGKQKYKFLVECRVCNREWESNFSNLRDNGCARCSGKEKGSMQKLQESLIEKSIEVSGEYVNALTKVDCLCKSCNERWQSTPHNLSYHGCPFCCFKGRIPKDRSASLYYIRIENELGKYWKIGITTKEDVLRRFDKDNGNGAITLLYSFLFENGEQAYYAEKNILRWYKEYLVKDVKILADGNTEIFTRDVLQMDHLPSTERGA